MATAKMEKASATIVLQAVMANTNLLVGAYDVATINPAVAASPTTATTLRGSEPLIRASTRAIISCPAAK